MAQLQRANLGIYAAVLLAALVGVLLVARRRESGAQSPSTRAAPELVRVSPGTRPPRPLAIPPNAIPVAESLLSRSEVPAAFPANDSGAVTEDPQDIGPISEAEANDHPTGPIFPQNGPYQSWQVPPGEEMRRLPAVESENPAPGPHLVEPQQTEARPSYEDEQPSLYAPAPAAQEQGSVQPALPGHTESAPSSQLVTTEDEALRPVMQQAALLNRQAESLARRGAFYLARNQATQALRMMAEGLDLQGNEGEHTASLARALTALREADDFLPRSGEDSAIDLALIVPAHRTPILRHRRLEGVSPVAALQQYYTYARQQLASAAGAQPVASHSLFLLGKLQARMSPGQGASGNVQQTQLAKAMVFHQAAVVVDPRNHLAANELGVILVSFGQLQDARRVLTQSLAIHSHPDGWHNLAVVHDRLGEAEMAAHARKQCELLTGASTLQPRPKVEWVSPEVFAQNGPAGSSAPATPVAGSGTDRSADSRSQRKETWLSPFGSIKR